MDSSHGPFMSSRAAFRSTSSIPHHHRWLQRAGKDSPQCDPKQTDLSSGGDPGWCGGQVAGGPDGVGLAGSGRPIQQDAPCESIAEPSRLRRLPTKLKTLRSSSFSVAFGQDHVPR
jgi:hypothetical protein